MEPRVDDVLSGTRLLPHVASGATAGLQLPLLLGPLHQPPHEHRAVGAATEAPGNGGALMQDGHS